MGWKLKMDSKFLKAQGYKSVGREHSVNAEIKIEHTLFLPSFKGWFITKFAIVCEISFGYLFLFLTIPREVKSQGLGV